MGLRVASDTGVLTALRAVRASRAGEAGSLERLGSGLRVNRASDDPSGIVLSERLRTQLSALSQALENNQNARGLVDTADAALGTVSGLLERARSLAVAAANDGALDPAQRKSLQSALDQTLSAIDRIGATTRYGGRALLNGGFELAVRNADPAIANIRLFGAEMTDGLPRTVTINVVAGAAQARAAGALAPVQGAASTVRLSGPLGSFDFNFFAGQSEAAVAQAINEATSATGVEVAGLPGARIIRSVDYGTAAFVRVEEVSGDLAGIAPGHTAGADVNAIVDGQAASGRGNTLNVVDGVTGEITFAPGTGAGAYAFEVTGGGAAFQVGAGPVPAARVTLGIPAVSAVRLGASSGVGALSSLATGGVNDLSTNPGNAGRVLAAAGSEIADLRGALGALSSKIFDANQSALEVEFESLAGAESGLRDADFAREIAAAERFALLRRMGVNVLRHTHLTNGAALRLLS